MLDLTKITNIEFDGIDYSDAPDFCDAYISQAFINNRQLNEKELDWLNNQREFVYESLMSWMY